MSTSRKIVIIGNGIAGTTCARHVRKRSDDHITIISSESKYFFSRTALMYVYMGHMQWDHLKPYEDWFWTKNRINLVHSRVLRIDTNSSHVELSGGEIVPFDILVLATGSKTKKYGWPGQDLNGVCGMYSLQDLEAIQKHTAGIRNAVIVGGGLIGVELAEMLHSRKIHVTVLVREKSWWRNVLPEAESLMIGTHISSHGIGIKYQSELSEIVADETGTVTYVLTKDGEKINCNFVGITTGVEPNIDFVRGSAIKTDRGILVDNQFETSVENIFAIGDCAQFIAPVSNRKPVEQIWYTARIHGETLALTLTGNRSHYQPGPWFNSAKFFDIEYQNYGIVKANFSDDEESFHWQHPEREILVRFNWNKADGSLIGVNAFGIRLRHEIFDRWIREKQTIDFVMKNLHKANFDPEFFERYEKQIVSAFNRRKHQTMLTS